MYFQWLQPLASNRIRMRDASLFIVYSALSFFCPMSAISQERVYVSALNAWMWIVCVHAWLCVCLCALVWMCVHCLCMCARVCLRVSVSVFACLSRRFSWLVLRVWLTYAYNSYGNCSVLATFRSQSTTVVYTLCHWLPTGDGWINLKYREWLCPKRQKHWPF